MANFYESEVWLVVSAGKRWRKLEIRLAIKQPTLKPGEIPIKATIKLPEAIFKTPQFHAKIEVPDNGAQLPVVEIQQDLATFAREQLGINISFESINPET